MLALSLDYTCAQASGLDIAHGASEKRSELYIGYYERASQLATQRNAKSLRRVNGFAGEQMQASWRLR
jgi:hypothetical protein